MGLLNSLEVSTAPRSVVGSQQVLELVLTPLSDSPVTDTTLGDPLAQLSPISSLWLPLKKIITCFGFIT